MKPQLLKIVYGVTDSFSIRKDEGPFFYNKWHYHPEVELLHIVKGKGTQFVGDSISAFKDGDILLVGSHLPHFWRCDDEYFKSGSTLKAVAVVAHFNENFWGDKFLDLSENKPIKSLLAKARQGILVGGNSKTEVARLLHQMLQAKDTDRIIYLLQALKEIARNVDNVVLSSVALQANNNEEAECISNIYNYSFANFSRKISLEEIAAVAHISPHSFCRYFKKKTRKTYSRFLQELRIGHACKLLLESRLTYAQICDACGFNNFTNFHRYFKAITGKTPSQYKKEFTAN